MCVLIIVHSCLLNTVWKQSDNLPSPPPHSLSKLVETKPWRHKCIKAQQGCTTVCIYGVCCDQRYNRETQVDHKDRRKDQVPAQRRRPWQARATAAIYRQKEPTTWKMGRNETLFRIPGVYCHLYLICDVFLFYYRSVFVTLDSFFWSFPG